MVRSRCQARTQTCSSLIASRGVRFIVPFPPQELVMRETVQLGVISLNQRLWHFFEGSRQGWRRLHSHTFSQVGVVGIWKDGYKYKPWWGNFSFSFFGGSYNLKIPGVLILGGTCFLDATCNSRQGSHLCSLLLLLVIHMKWDKEGDACGVFRYLGRNSYMPWINETWHYRCLCGGPGGSPTWLHQPFGIKGFESCVHSHYGEHVSV